MSCPFELGDQVAYREAFADDGSIHADAVREVIHVAGDGTVTARNDAETVEDGWELFGIVTEGTPIVG